MDYSDTILGGFAARKLREKATTALLRIGSDRFTRSDLSKVECFNFNAASNLSRILNEHLNVKSTRDVFDHIAPVDLALPQLGLISLAVLGACFEAKGLGGNAPLENWAKQHLEKDEEIVGFASIKKTAHDHNSKDRSLRSRRKKG